MRPTLLVLAAGMGSRFGGLKQMESVGPNGEWILDYSVFDAIKAGFGKVVFVIRAEMESAFRNLTESKYGESIELEYAFQRLEDTPLPISVDHRLKPWGTGHAVYAARNHLDGPCSVINADDFYGAEAFQALANFLKDPKRQSNKTTCALVGYELNKTLSENGSVSRGICRRKENDELLAIEEHTEIHRDENGQIVGLNGTHDPVSLNLDTLVSLNCWGFPANWIMNLEELFSRFLEERGNEAKSEFYLPAAVDSLIAQDDHRALVLPCKEQWLGVTHREDLASVQRAVAGLVEDEIYPSPLR